MTDKASTTTKAISSDTAMSGPGSPNSPRPAHHHDPGAEGGSGSGSGSKGHSSKSGSMKVKRTTSGSKVASRGSKGSSMKKKASEAKGSSSKTSADLTDSATGEMEMLTQKQNGSAGEGGGPGVGGGGTEEQEQDEKKEHRATIKGLWKKAFKSLKSSSGGEQKWSIKKGGSLKRRDSKEAEEAEPEEPKEIDPVYSLLKCAADLPRASRATKDGGGGGGGGGQLTPQTPGGTAPCTGLVARHGDSSGSTSKASSPSSSGLPPAAPDGTCTRCGAVHHVDMLMTQPGQDFKEYYRQTSPVKRQMSSDLPSV